MTKFSILVLLVAFSISGSGCFRQKDDAFGSQSNSTGSVIPDGFGVNIHFTDANLGEIKMLSEAGLRWVRMDLKWDSTETQPGRYA